MDQSLKDWQDQSRIKREEKEKAKGYDGNVLREEPFELGL